MNCVDESRIFFVKERGISGRNNKEEEERREREKAITIKKSVSGGSGRAGERERKKSGSKVGGSGRGGREGSQREREREREREKKVLLGECRLFEISSKFPGILVSFLSDSRNIESELTIPKNFS
jgi:hypothetical protein